MNKEDYVSFEVAKLLKEKGFNIKCSHYWGQDKDQAILDWEGFKFTKEWLEINNNFYKDVWPAPTLYETQKWIRLSYGIYVYPSVYLSKDNDESCNYIVDAYKYNNDYWEAFIINTIKYETYEEALNAGILEALKLI